MGNFSTTSPQYATSLYHRAGLAPAWSPPLHSFPTRLCDSLRQAWRPLCILTFCFLQVHDLATFCCPFAHYFCWARLQTSSFIVGVVAQTRHAQLHCPPNCDFLKEQKSLTFAPKPYDAKWQVPTAGTHHWKRTSERQTALMGPLTRTKCCAPAERCSAVPGGPRRGTRLPPK